MVDDNRISYEDALKLLRKYIKDENRIKHLIGVSEFAFEFSKKLKQRHPEIDIDPHELRIAGLLHDIGRCKSGNHALRSIEILKKEGLGKIADFVLHGPIYEKHLVKGVDNKNLLPSTIEQKIITYSDLRFRLSPMTLKQRIADIKERNKDKQDTLKAFDLAEKRFYDLEKELFEMLK